MTLFWKPTDSQHTNSLSLTKTLGHGLYVLWGRCDVCCWSGPSYHMMLFERGDETANICVQCDENEDLRRQLLADGWVTR